LSCPDTKHQSAFDIVKFLIFLKIAIVYLFINFKILNLHWNINRSTTVNHQNIQIITTNTIEQTEEKQNSIISLQLEEFYKKNEHVFNTIESINDRYNKFLRNFISSFEAVKGILYVFDEKGNNYNPMAFFACPNDTDISSFLSGDGLPGQVAVDKKTFILRKPENYSITHSGLGKGAPEYIAFIPIIQNNISVSIIEAAFFKEIDSEMESAFQSMSVGIGKRIKF
jgi:hypothetical protein